MNKKYIFHFLSFFICLNGINAQCTIPPIYLGPDTILCPGQSILLNAASNGAYTNYLWNNNSTLPNRTITSSGTYSVLGTFLGPNVIINGDFESGNTGFSTNYVYGTGGSWGLLSSPGQFAIVSSPNLAHSNFSSCADHTPAPGVNMLVVNGAATAATNVWCQTVTIQPNTNYQLSAWISNALNDPNVAQLQFSINGSSVGPVFSTGTTGCNWQQFFQVWNSGTGTSANICILNQNVGGSGNDFMLDDITFRPVCVSTDTIVVTYSTNPIVNLGPDQFECEGTIVTLDAQNTGLSYSWTGGSTNQTISVDTSGNYQVTVTNSDLCSTSDNVNVTFEVQKSAGNDLQNTWCTTNGIQDLNTFLNSNADLGGIWNDQSGTMNGQLSAAGMLALNTIQGMHEALYVVSGTYCPNDSCLFDITVNRQPSAVSTANLSLCNTVGDFEDLSPLIFGVTADLTPFWLENSINPSNQFDENTGVLDLSNLTGDTYEFLYVLPAQSPCINDTSFVNVIITENPIIQFSSDVVKGCYPLNVSFINQSIYDVNSLVNWTLEDGTLSNIPAGFSHQFQSPTCFDVTLSITANNLCTTEETIVDMICVDPLPVADFISDLSVAYSDDPSVQFTNQSILNDINQWYFDDETNSGEVNPMHQFPIGQVGNYNVQLIVTSSEGCKDTTYRIIRVQDQLLLYVPNAFTPDDDEFNNVFMPIISAGIDKLTYQFSIFDRWGHLVFQSHNLDIGWDGTYNQNNVEPGAYAWKIEFKDEKTDEKKVFMGHVSLLR
jgi:gliding motility-associated-like protein